MEAKASEFSGVLPKMTSLVMALFHDQMVSHGDDDPIPVMM